MEDSEINYWVRTLKDALAVSEFHFRDAVINLIERSADESRDWE